MKQILIIFCLCFIILSSSNAEKGISTTGIPILTTRIEPRPIGMGESFTGVADDVNSIYYNPAGLVQIEDNKGALYYQKAYDDMHYGSCVYAHALDDQDGFGACINLFHLGNMDFFHEDGNIENVEIGNSLLFGVTYAHLFLKDRLSIGTKAKLISSKLGEYSAKTVAFDLGFLYHPFSILNAKNGGYRIGLSIQNIGPGLKYLDEKDPLPLTARVGIAYLLFKNRYQLLVSSDVINVFENSSISINSGTELLIARVLALRIGYQHYFDNIEGVFTSGLGLYVYPYQFDYGIKITSNELQGIDHYFALMYTF